MAKTKKVKEEVVIDSPINVETITNGNDAAMTISHEVIKEINETIEIVKEETSLESKILEFAGVEIKRVNDFLISLYTEKLANDISINKTIKETLSNMANKGEIEVISNRHMDLAMSYYDEEGKAKKHNILNTDIFIKK